MAMVNVAKDYRKYSSEELRSLAYQGLLECNGYDLSDFVERIFSDYKLETDQEEVESARQEAYDEGYSDARGAAVSACENI